jgi:ribonucleotide monophosphatase NagD (HAD superfamily)
MGYSIAKKLGMECVSQRTVQNNDAVMFDIDETLFHNDGTPISDMIELFHFCRQLGYRIIIITARPDFAIVHYHTRIQLISYNLYPDEVYFVPAIEKNDVKKQTGLHYVLSVGDLRTDLGLSDYFIKLPDSSDARVYSNINI